MDTQTKSQYNLIHSVSVAGSGLSSGTDVWSVSSTWARAQERRFLKGSRVESKRLSGSHPLWACRVAAAGCCPVCICMWVMSAETLCRCLGCNGEMSLDGKTGADPKGPWELS